MKRMTKALSILLAVLMLASAACLSVFAQSKYDYKKVTLIGDSIATALRMEWRGEGAPPADIAQYYKYNEDSGKWTRTGATHGAWIENSYPSRVVRAVGLGENDLYNYGREAFSSIEFRRLLDASYAPDEEDIAISDGLYAAYGADLKGHDLAYQQKQVKKDLADSDLVIVGMGSNDIFSYAMVHYSNVSAGLESTPLTAAQKQALIALNDVIEPLVANGQFAEAWATLFNLASTINALQQTAVVLVKAILQGVQKFIENWDQIINKIHEYNPDATVVAVGLFNAVAGLYLTDSIKLDLGQVMSPVFDTMNGHMKSYAQKTGYYTYVDATKTDHPAWPTGMELIRDTSQIMYYMMICTHPTYAGQEYIAEQILKVLPEKPSTRTVKKNSKDGNWYLYDGDKIDYSYTGIAKNEYGWWRIEKGKVNFNANGVYKNEYGWWYVKDGKVDFSYTGFASNKYGTWRIVKGKVDFKADGVVGEQKDWRYVSGGKVQNVTGVYSNRFGRWYVKNGKVDFSKTGTVKVNGRTYVVYGGRVVV
ncbi:MAG: hypothetical protein J5847_00070 [Clostridia bacterium]|nr:hypothetical protein [Clostridia bacterium]